MTYKERVIKAMNDDNSIVVTKDTLKESNGYTYGYLLSLGLRKSDLKKMERQGRAVRGYTQVAIGGIYRGHMTQARWVLLNNQE